MLHTHTVGNAAGGYHTTRTEKSSYYLLIGDYELLFKDSVNKIVSKPVYRELRTAGKIRKWWSMVYYTPLFSTQP